ncbi:glycoside hydrolase superfamily [Obelidium mucronatum]|nr:glycoside hydrolase superfamily [Obelidium mucronatum]
MSFFGSRRSIFMAFLMLCSSIYLYSHFVSFQISLADNRRFAVFPGSRPASDFLWPHPSNLTDLNYSVLLPRGGFRIASANVKNSPQIQHGMNVVRRAFSTRTQPITRHFNTHRKTDLFPVSIHVANSNILDPADLPTVDESYSLFINSQRVTIESETTVGALYALQSLSQLITKDGFLITVNITHDYPRFPYRGFLLDTARNFFTIKDIKRIMNGLALSRINVFHWHIYDSQSFPIDWSRYPELSKKATFKYNDGSPKLYTEKDVKDLIEYALARNIRIIPEFELPGHNAVFGHIDKDLIVDWNHSPWDGGNGRPANATNRGRFPEMFVERGREHCASPPCGQLDVRRPDAILLIENLIRDIGTWFKDPILHVGHDEVNARGYGLIPEAWDIVPADVIHPLMYEFEPKLLEILKKFNKSYGGWDEVALDFGIHDLIPKNALITVWRDFQTIPNITARGFSNIVISPKFFYYLDCSPSAIGCQRPDEKAYPTTKYNLTGFTSVPGQWHHWTSLYEFDPLENLDSQSAQAIKGAFGSLWSETVKRHNLDRYVFPRISVIGEKLWSYRNAPPLVGSNTEARLNRFRASLVNEFEIGAAPLDYFGNDEGVIFRTEYCDGETRRTSASQKLSHAGVYSGCPELDGAGNVPKNTYYEVPADYCAISLLYQTNELVYNIPDTIEYPF